MPSVRASATSKIASAHHHAALNKPDTNKSDEASPFALLMKSTASKETAKTPHKDAHDDKHINDSRAVKTDNKAEAATQAQAKSASKTDKADKSDDKPIVAKEGAAKEEKTVHTDTAADNQTQAAEPQPVNPQIQQAAQPAITAAIDDTGEAENITAAAAAQDTKAAQNNAAPEPGDETQDVQAGKPAGPQTAANPATTKTSDGKADGVKTAKNNNAAANDIKADPANATQNDKAAAATDAAAPKPSAPQPVNAEADNAITAPQTLRPLQSAQAPVPAQHLHVTAQPTPNVPALAVEIAAKSQSGAKQFDIRLDPPELGRVEVRLSIDATGKASAHLSADQPQTLDLLQKDAPALTRALREAGLNVSQDGLNFSLRHQASQDGGANHGGSRGSSRGFALSASTSIEATATSAAYRGVADGRLDIKV
jgi:flagellar hook-length control protein FliK